MHRDYGRADTCGSACIVYAAPTTFVNETCFPLLSGSRDSMIKQVTSIISAKDSGRQRT